MLLCKYTFCNISSFITRASIICISCLFIGLVNEPNTAVSLFEYAEGKSSADYALSEFTPVFIGLAELTPEENIQINDLCGDIEV